MSGGRFAVHRIENVGRAKIGHKVTVGRKHVAGVAARVAVVFAKSIFDARIRRPAIRLRAMATIR